MRQAAVHSCVIISIYLLYVYVYYVIAKIRFQLGKLVQQLVSEGEKLHFQALEIQHFS